MHRIPSELRSKACLGESSTRMGDLLGSPRVAPHNFLFRPRGAAFRAVPSRRGGFTLYFAPKCPPVPPISPATSEAENVHLHLNAGGGSGTKREGWEMGAITPALTARIPPEPRGQGCLAVSSTGMGEPEESALVGPLIIIPRPPERLFARVAEARRRVKNDVKGRKSGCDHTSTNAPDPIKTPQLRVFGRV
ncbi:hypothetical protein Ancab_002194 [Ancistrocladus abbreviatus]